MWKKMMNQRFAPPHIQIPNFQKKLHHHHHHKKPLEVKFGKTEFINIPKENNEFDFKMRTIDETIDMKNASLADIKKTSILI